MSVLLTKIMIAIIGKLGGEMLRIAIKELYKEYIEQRASLTPEERAEWDRDWTEDFRTDE
uniref:Uncharacterized protein n=1 Tax=viral metagenome TaxID=1070528 RepID=A0A6M3KB22_9ZZZZ